MCYIWFVAKDYSKSFVELKDMPGQEGLKSNLLHMTFLWLKDERMTYLSYDTEQQNKH